jgi:hypothetical protein
VVYFPTLRKEGRKGGRRDCMKEGRKEGLYEEWKEGRTV